MVDTAHREAQIAQLRQFFDAVKSEELFSQAPADLPPLRRQITTILRDLLVWGRPYLAATCGTWWPYHECSLIAPYLEKAYHQAGDRETRQQALLFLAFLPLPNQWRWLAKATVAYADVPEVAQFLQMERKKITAKLTGKGQSSFKLRHFVQILKSPHLPEEKGVLRIFSLPYLLLDRSLLRQIAENYVFFLEPPMGIVFRHCWWRMFTELADPCIFGLGGDEDRRFVAMQAHTHVLDLAHGDFLPDTSQPEPLVEKDIDIIFNATFDDMERKRHLLMLQLLNHPRLRGKKALFIGRGADKNVKAFRQEVSRLYMDDRVITRANVRRQDLASYFLRCKTGVHLSLYENSCRCIYEFFRAGIPCIVSSATAGINRHIFNRYTGRVVDDKELPEAIALMIRKHDEYAPRKWFIDNSGSFHSSNRLGDQLARFFIDHGYRWQDDIVPLDSSGANRYLCDDHYRRFLPQFQELLAWIQPVVPSSIKLIVDDP